MKINRLLALLFLSVYILSGCKKDEEDPQPTDTGYSVPTTYSFSGAQYADATTIITMMSKIDSVTGNGTTTTVSQTVLNNMYTNTGSPFLQSDLNSSSLKVSDKTILAAQADFEDFMDSVALNSAFPVVTYVPGANDNAGVAGVATAANGTSKYLLNEYGVEYKQVLSKAFMGGIILNQMQQHLSGASIGSSVAKATKQQNWDLAFGYFGVPTDFPTNTTGLKYIGNYANNAGIKAIIPYNTIIMNAFLAGRAAIDNDDQATVDAQAAIILTKVEELLAAAAIHYMNDTKDPAVIGNDASRSHALSEGIGFILAIKYAGVNISPSQADAIIGFLGTNLANISPTDLDNVKDYLSAIYGLDEVKDDL